MGFLEEDFNPRSPHGERPDPPTIGRIAPEFQSTLPARGATADGGGNPAAGGISIHAPRTGSDQINGCRLPQPAAFQPTLPARGATTGTVYQPGYFLFQPTLPARGATAAMIATLSPKKTFQPTLPARGATHHAPCKNGCRWISTHAPRTGSDSRPRTTTRPKR